MHTSSPKLSIKHCAFVSLNSSTPCLYIKLTPHSLPMYILWSLNITLIWLHSPFPTLANQSARDKYNRQILFLSLIVVVKCSETRSFWGILPRAITLALISYSEEYFMYDSDAQRANPIHLLLYQFEGSSMLIEVSFISAKHDGIIDPSKTSLRWRSPCTQTKTQLLLTVTI